jgi:hypothetical protein
MSLACTGPGALDESGAPPGEHSKEQIQMKNNVRGTSFRSARLSRQSPSHQ